MHGAQPPGRYVWDFWYTHDPYTDTFHVMFLNCESRHGGSPEQHLRAQVGYARTSDFVDFDWVDNSVLAARPDHWDNTSIWTGDVLPIAEGYLCFYTSRDGHQTDGTVQQIGAAWSQDFIRWERVDHLRICADPRFYTTSSLPDDDTIHAWRDPWLFRHDGVAHMLVCAKSPVLPSGRRGQVALLRARDATLLDWEHVGPLHSPGTASECEVPQMVVDAGRLGLVYSVGAKFDHSRDGLGGLRIAMTREPGSLSAGTAEDRCLLPAISGINAARVVPELDGEIIGHDLANGGIVRSGVHTGFTGPDRDFGDVPVPQPREVGGRRGAASSDPT